MSYHSTSSRVAHWTEGEQSGKSPRGVIIALLLLVILTALAAFLYLTLWPSPPLPRTVFQGWYVADYDDRVLFDLPFAESSTKLLAEKFGGQAEELNSVSISNAVLSGPQWDTMERSSDVAVVYLRAYATASLDDAQQLRAEILTEGFAGQFASDHRVPVREICEQLIKIPAAAIVLLLDCAELEHTSSLGVLANGFSQALEEELAAEKSSQWERLWVIHCNALLQPAHVSWHHRQTLLVASLTQTDMEDFDVMESDRSISLAEMYDGMLRICADQSGNKQTPILLRGGSGLVNPSENNKEWKEASRIPVMRLAAAKADDKPEADSDADNATDSPSSEAEQPVTADDSTADPAADRTAEATAEATDEPEKPVSFAEAPRRATWTARDRLRRRETTNGWSPADYAPAIWGRVQHQLIALDQQTRLKSLANGPESELENTKSKLEDLYKAFVYLANPKGSPPKTSPGLADELLKSYELFEALPAKPFWERDDDLRPAQVADWRQIKSSLRSYSDATIALPWWIDLAAQLRDRELLEHSQRLHDHIIQFKNNIESQRGELEPTTVTQRRLTGDSRLIEERLEKLQRRLREIVAERSSQWVSQWTSAHLLRSPLLDWSLRAEVQQTLANTDNHQEPKKLLVQRTADLAAIYGFTHRNRGNATSEWSFYGELATLYEQLLDSTVAVDAELDAASPVREPINSNVPVSSAVSALEWGKWYRTQLIAQVKQKSSGYALWRSSAVLGAALAKIESAESTEQITLTNPATAMAAMVIPPVLDDSLQASPTNPETLILSSGDHWETLDSIQLRIPGEEITQEFSGQEFRLALANEVAGNLELWKGLEIRVKGADDQWRSIERKELESNRDGLPIQIPRDGKLEIRFKARGEAAARNPSERLTIPLRITPAKREDNKRKIQPAAIEIKLLPPRPNQVDMWISTYSPVPAEERQGARRNLAIKDYGLFAQERGALVSIPSAENGVPYRLWLENQSREPKWVRAKLYPLDMANKGVARPGRVVASGDIPDEVRQLVDDILANKTEAWAECIPAQLLPKRDQQSGNNRTETVASDNDAERLSDSATLLAGWKILAPGGDEPQSLSIPNGFVCLIEEMEPPQVVEGEANAETSPPLPTKKQPGGKHWLKLIEVATHPMIMEPTDVLAPLVKVEPALSYDQQRGEYSINLNKTAAWDRYGVETLPLKLEFLNQTPDSLRISKPLNGELNLEKSRVELTARFEPRPRLGQTGIFALSLGGYPRRFYYHLMLQDQGQATTYQGAEFVDSRLQSVVPLLDPLSRQKFEPQEQEQPFAELRESENQTAIVLLHRRSENNRRVSVDYSGIELKAEIDAPWLAFQKFDTPQGRDRVRAVVSRTGGPPVAAQERYSPRDEAFSLVADPGENASILRLRSQVTDHRFELPLPTEEGTYQAYIELLVDSVPRTSEKRTIIVDHTPPEKGTVEVKPGTLAGRRLYEGEQFDVQLEIEDKRSRVKEVEFAIRLYESREIALDNGIPVNGGPLWKTTVSSDALKDIPDGEYTIIAKAEDLAGNIQADHTPYRFYWMNSARPTAAAASSNSPSNDGERKAEDQKLYGLVFKFTRQLGSSKKFDITLPNLIQGIQVSGLKGDEQKGTKSISFTDIPAGEYTVKFSTDWQMGNHIAEKTIEMPRDDGKEISINLSFEPKEDN